MALTINPAVSGTRKRWLAHIVAFFIGVLIGGFLSLALAIMLIRTAAVLLPHGALVGCLLAIIAWAVGKDLGLPLWLPYRQQQVPEWLRDALPPGAIAVFYGAMLGVGFLTLYTYSAQLAMLVTLPLLGTGGTMLGAIAAFAAGKTLVLWVAAGAPSIDAVGGRFHWTHRRAQVLRLTTAAMSVAVAASLAATLIR